MGEETQRHLEHRHPEHDQCPPDAARHLGKERADQKQQRYSWENENATRGMLRIDFTVVHRIHDPEGWGNGLSSEHTFPPDFHLHSFVEAEDRRLALCVWEVPSEAALQEALDRIFGHAAVNEVVPAALRVRVDVEWKTMCLAGEPEFEGRHGALTLERQCG